MPDRRRRMGLGALGLLAVATVGAFAVPSRAAPADPPRPLRVLWVGDSFTAAVGSSTGRGYPTIICAKLHWQCVVDAEGGTGFVADGSNNSAAFAPFIDRLEGDASRAVADVVIVDGGRNDERKPPAAVSTRVAQYSAALRAAFPQARLVFVVPTFLHPQTDAEARIGRLLAQSAAQQSGEFIDPGTLRWFLTDQQGKTLTARDGVHPDDAGHAYLADRLLQALLGLGLG